MADIAEIGFRAETGQLSDAKAKLEALSPAAAKAEKASDQLARAMDKTSVAAARAAAAQANAVLKAARASDTATRSDVQAAAAAKRNADAVLASARAIELKANADRAAAASGAAQAKSAHAQAVANRAAGEAAEGAAQDIMRMQVASNDNMNIMRSNTANIAAQFQDIGVTAAMGMNPLMIALQQGTQLSAVFAMSTESAGKTIAAAFASIFSWTSLLVIGLVALVAAGLQFLDWAALGAGAMNALATAMEYAAPYIIGVSAALALIYAPAIIMGIMSTIALMGRLAVSAAMAAAAMALANPAVALVAGIAIAIAAANIFRDELTRIFGFDIVQAAKDGGNLIIAIMVAAFNTIRTAGASLPAAFGDLGYRIANKFMEGIYWMAREAVVTVNSVIAKTNGMLRSAMGANAPQLPDLGMPTMGLGGGGIQNPYAGAMDNVGAVAADAFAEARKVDYIGTGIATIEKGASAAAGKVRELAKEVAALGAGEDGKGGKGKKGGGGAGAEKTDPFQEIVEGAERNIATLQAERDAIGLSEEATARLKYETDLLNQAKQKNIDLSPAQSATLKALAGDMARLESETKKAKDTLEFAKSTTKGFIQDFISGIKNGESVWESFGKAAMNVLDKIGQRLVDMAIDNLFTSPGGGSGSGGGIGSLIAKGISWLFGGGSALGNVFDNGLQQYAKGGSFTNSVVSRPTLFSYAKGGAIGEMGEAGPEAIIPLERGPDGSLGVQMFGGSGRSAAPANNNVEVHNHYTISGAISEEKIVAQIKQTAEQTKDETKKSMVGWLNQYSRDGAFS